MGFAYDRKKTIKKAAHKTKRKPQPRFLPEILLPSLGKSAAFLSADVQFGFPFYLHP